MAVWEKPILAAFVLGKPIAVLGKTYFCALRAGHYLISGACRGRSPFCIIRKNPRSCWEKKPLYFQENPLLFGKNLFQQSFGVGRSLVFFRIPIKPRIFCLDLPDPRQSANLNQQVNSFYGSLELSIPAYLSGGPRRDSFCMNIFGHRVHWNSLIPLWTISGLERWLNLRNLLVTIATLKCRRNPRRLSRSKVLVP